MGNERRDITADLMDIKRLIKKYCEQLYAHRFDNLDEMGQFHEKYNLPNSHKKK